MKELVPMELSDEYIDTKVNAYLNSATYLTVEDVYGKNQKTIVNGLNIGNRLREQSPIIKEFFECLRTDLKNISVEDYMSPKETTKYRVNTDEGRIYILESYENCLAFLEKYNAIPELTEADYMNMISDSAVEIYKVTSIDHDNLGESYSYSSSDQDYYYDISIINHFDENVQRLLEVAQGQYITKEPCYKIRVYGEQFIIPTEYTDLAQTVMWNNAVSDDVYYGYEYEAYYK